MPDPRRHEIQYAAPDAFTPYARNARTHSEAQIAQLVASIEAFGFTNPLLVDEKRVIIAGHGRQMAASRRGLKEIPYIVLSGLTSAQKRALVLSDNKLAANAGWDMDLLRLELTELGADGFNLELTGFNSLELTDIFATRVGKVDPEEAPPVPETPVSRLGDVWLCGPHRIRCGDSTNADDVAAALKGAKPNLMVTDPPYGVEYDPNWRNRASRNTPGLGPARSIGAGAIGLVQNDDNADWTAAWNLYAGDVAYVWHAGVRAGEVQASLDAARLETRSQIVWVKQQFAIGRGHYHWQHELCWYVVRKGATGHWEGGRKQSTVWEIDKPAKSETGHSTQKPIECMERPIVNHTKAGEPVYDPFLGSGTTVIAAEKNGRVCLGLEILPAYVDVIVRRWQQFTGKNATLEHEGRAGATFAATAKARKVRIPEPTEA